MILLLVLTDTTVGVGCNGSKVWYDCRLKDVKQPSAIVVESVDVSVSTVKPANV